MGIGGHQGLPSRLSGRGWPSLGNWYRHGRHAAGMCGGESCGSNSLVYAAISRGYDGALWGDVGVVAGVRVSSGGGRKQAAGLMRVQTRREAA